MLDTSLSDQDRYPLKLADLLVHHLDPRMAPAKLVWGNDPDRIINDLASVGLAGDRYHRPLWLSNEMADYTGSVMAIDPSGRGNDETAYAVVKVLHGNLFLVASGGFKDGYSEATLKGLSVLAKLHSVNHIIVEANFGDGMFVSLMKPILVKVHNCMIEEVRHSSQKERRIADTLEPVMNSHRLIVDHRVIKQDAESEPQYQLFYQLTRLTRDKGALRQDDRLDALAMAVGYWVEHMARDNQTAIEEHLEKLRDEELEKFRQLVLGSNGDEGRGWLS
jgi:hypothetical protein